MRKEITDDMFWNLVKSHLTVLDARCNLRVSETYILDTDEESIITEMGLDDFRGFLQMRDLNDWIEFKSIQSKT